MKINTIFISVSILFASLLYCLPAAALTAQDTCSPNVLTFSASGEKQTTACTWGIGATDKDIRVKLVLNNPEKKVEGACTFTPKGDDRVTGIWGSPAFTVWGNLSNIKINSSLTGDNAPVLFVYAEKGNAGNRLECSFTAK